MKRILDKFFAPRSIAVFGATEKIGKPGFAVWNNLLSSTYQGALFPINPKYDQLGKFNCHAKARTLPETPDLAIVATPPPTISDILHDCGRKKIECVLILSAITPEERETFWQNIRPIAEKYGIYLIGPGSIGIQSPQLHLNASVAQAMPTKGRLAFITQSGALGASVLDWAADKNVGLSHFVHTGDVADTGLDQLIDYLGTDNTTSCILIYLEHLSDARKFMSAARAFARSKPIVVLKPGITQEAVRASQRHTGIQPADDAVFDAALRRCGVIRVQTVQQLFDCAHALAMQPLPAGARLAIVTNAGGPGVLATDALIQRGGQLATLAPETLQQLEKNTRNTWLANNPMDIQDQARPEDFERAVHACLMDPGTDALLAILAPHAVISPEITAHALVRESKTVYNKPVYASWMGPKSMLPGREVLEQGKVPWYPFPERAVTVFMHMVNYRQNLDLLFETPSDLPLGFPDIQKHEARNLILAIRQEGRTHLHKSECTQILNAYGIPCNPSLLALTEQEAVDFAGKLGYPIAMKIESPDIDNKSEVHGVRLGIESENGVRQVFHFLLENTREAKPEARITGITLEPMVPTDFELLIEARKDPVFGAYILFGAGGPATDIRSDHRIGLPPLNMALAKNLVGSARLTANNRKNANLELLQGVLVRFAYLIMDLPEIQSVRINPFALDHKSGAVLDARITLEPDSFTQEAAYDHLSIVPYPSQWSKQITLKDGSPLLLRPIRPEDEPLEAQMVKETSRESLYFRFFGFIPGIDHKLLSRFTQIDYDREMAIVAEIRQDGRPKLVGVVRIVGDGWRESAEYAILVADAWQGKGVGSLLTDYILEYAKAKGYKRIVASFLKTNGAMRRLFQKKGFRIKAEADETNYAEKIL